MSDEEHRETGESTAPDSNTAGAEDQPRADPGPSAVEDGSAEVLELIGRDEEEQKQEEQRAVPENASPETVYESQPDTVGVDESGYVPPELESVMVSPEEAGTPEDKGGDDEEEQHEEQAAVPEDLPTETVDELQGQLDSAEEEVLAPLEPHEIAASLTEDGLLEAPDNGYKDTVVSQPSDILDDGTESNKLDEDYPQSAEQLADQPDEAMPYPSADKIDVLELGDEVDKLAAVDEGDQPDPTRAFEQVGPVQECPEVPTPPPLLVEGRDDIESLKDERVVPTVLVRFYAQFLH